MGGYLDKGGGPCPLVGEKYAAASRQERSKLLPTALQEDAACTAWSYLTGCARSCTFTAVSDRAAHVLAQASQLWTTGSISIHWPGVIAGGAPTRHLSPTRGSYQQGGCG